MVFGYEKKRNDFEMYKESGRPVRIKWGDDYHIGFINKITDTDIYLKPSIVSQNLPSSDGQTKYSAFIEKELPKRIPSQHIGVEPLTNKYLEDLVRAMNSIEVPKINTKKRSLNNKKQITN